jgi:hypothetical protein
MRYATPGALESAAKMLLIAIGNTNAQKKQENPANIRMLQHIICSSTITPDVAARDELSDWHKHAISY